MKTEILGVSFDNCTMPEAVAQALAFAKSGGCHYVVTPNPEIVMAANKDEGYAKVLAGASLTLPDGIGIIYAAKILGRPLKGRVPGVDFAGELMAQMAKNGLKLYLLGAKPGIAERAAEKLTLQYPGLEICGTADGYFKDDAAAAAEIKKTGADVVFVCLGAPKQEKFMAEYGPATGAHLLLGIGGALDVFSGTVQRAPERWQKLGMEWFYRLLHEPSRAGRMVKLPWFLVQAAGARMKGK